MGTLFRLHRTFAACALLLAGAAACGPPGQRRDTERAPDVVSGDVVSGDLVTSGRHVRIEAEVRGDVAAAGNDVSISAPVGGYVMGAGRMVTLSGPIGNDVWAAGQEVRIDDRVGSNAMVAGRTVVLGPNAAVAQNARLAGQHVRSEAHVGRNLEIRAGTAEIGGEIEGAVEAHAKSVTILPGTIIHGDLVVRSSERPAVPETAQVLGNVRYREERSTSRWQTWPWFWLAAFASLLLLGLAEIAFSRSWASRVSETMRRRIGPSIGIGVLILVAAPVVAALLLVTVVGIPLAIVLMALYLAALILAAVFVSYRVGQWFFERGHQPDVSPWAAMAVGALIVSLGIMLPFVGWLVALVVLAIGAGALALERRDLRGQVRGAAA